MCNLSFNSILDVVIAIHKGLGFTFMALNLQRNCVDIWQISKRCLKIARKNEYS